MKVVLLGPTGQVGGMICQLWREAGLQSKLPLTTLGRSGADYNLDLTSTENLFKTLDYLCPDIIINAVAYTAVDKAESDQAASFVLNCDLPSRLADWCEVQGSLLIHYSTDFVFDGQKQGAWLESDATGPLSVYGQSKLAGEKALQMVAASSITLRTSWVYGETGNNFMKTMLRLARERDTLGVVNDQQGVPTYSRDLARATLQLIQAYLQQPELLSEKQQIFHLSNRGKTTWYGFAREIFAHAAQHEQLKLQQLNAITTADFPTPAQRPANSVMDCTLIEQQLGIRLPAWQDSLSEAMQRLYAMSN